MTTQLEQRLVDIVKRAPQRLEALTVLRSLRLPDWAIGAGYIRAAVWDELSGYRVPSPVEDID
ncbi:nucleotidyltransferase family protein, partial [Salmonella sp. SAL4446]|uniref:nucleotidyltransferase family protein n=1 Tax=Salmonella sp. SAL4446 TaxID=3159901 RepID=UPI003978078A